MDKKAFMHILKESLIGISDDEKNDILLDYEEHFNNALLEGKTEEEIIIKLGEPKDIARMFIKQEESTETIVEVKNEKKVNKGLRVVLMIFMNLLLPLWLFVTLWVIIISFFITGVSVALEGILVLTTLSLGVIILGGVSEMTAFLSGVALIPLGMVIFLLTMKFYGLSVGLTKKYIRWNINVINGERGGEHE